MSFEKYDIFCILYLNNFNYCFTESLLEHLKLSLDTFLRTYSDATATLRFFRSASIQRIGMALARVIRPSISSDVFEYRLT